MARWRGVALGVVCMAFCGCEAPTGIIPAAPPGTELVRKPPDSEQPAEALGEQGAKGPSGSAPVSAAEIEKIEPAPATAKGETKTTASGVKYETLKEGTGPEAKAGQLVRVHYTGTFENGETFDSSRDRGEPFPFTIGRKPFEVIVGWEEGVAGMKVGERRKLTIPPNAAYGEGGRGKIPPNSTLVFDLELMSIE